MRELVSVHILLNELHSYICVCEFICFGTGIKARVRFELH